MNLIISVVTSFFTYYRHHSYGLSDEEAWFISGWQHFTETTIMLIFFGLVFWFYCKPRWYEIISLENESTTPLSLNWMDKIIIGLLYICICLVLVYRNLRGGLIWMLQPCYPLTFVVLFCAHGSSPPWSQRFFYFYLYWLWAPLSALIWPTTADYEFPGELATFWIHHYIIVGFPFYYLLRGHFSLPKAHIYWAITSFTLISLYHLLILHPVSVWGKVNLNFVLVPHRQAQAMGLGTNWRPITYTICAGITLILFIAWKSFHTIILSLQPLMGENEIVNNKKKNK